MAKHAYRWIFAESPINDIETRLVDQSHFENEVKEWQGFNKEQRDAELGLTKNKSILKENGV